MTCAPSRPCIPAPPALGLVPPPPGSRVLRRRVGEFEAFARDLVRRIESRELEGVPLGRDWDVEGDPHGALLLDLWAYVAEIVAAYAELTAAEAYLGTASDWTDLRRLANGVGYRPRPRVAAQGWIRVEVDPGADPLLPAGTRVQAPGTPERASQTFEVAADTQLRADWNALTATWVPVAANVEGRTVRFLGDPGFGLGDLVLLVREKLPPTSCVPPSWSGAWTAEFWTAYFQWILCLYGLFTDAEPLAVASVVSRSSELGTTLVEFDRDLAGLLASETESYAAYRVLDSAGQARRLSKVVRITDSTVSTPDLSGLYGDAVAVTSTSIVLDAALDDLSAGQLVALVGWSGDDCDIVNVAAHSPVSWEVAPGTPTRASKLEFAEAVPTLVEALVDAALGKDASITAYVVDRRVLARHYVFPAEPSGTTQKQLRLYPAPAVAPERIAVETVVGGQAVWEVLGSRQSAAQEVPQAGDPPDAPRGLIVDLLEEPLGGLVQARASGNLARVRHGASASAVLGSGDATTPRQSFRLPDAPIAYDVDDDGSLVPTQELRVAGVLRQEVSSLYGAGPAEVFAVRLEVDGGLTVLFGDGEQGARLPTGRANVTSTYRVGGGTAGEVEGGAIDSLLGSVRGVKKVVGAGPTSGGADQDDERRLRALVPARARAFGRAVSASDLVDLSLGYPGVTHAAAWQGSGPPGCACDGSGLHLAFLRAGTGGPRPPQSSELTSLAGFLDARRDATVPLCVCAAATTDPPVQLTVELAVDPRRLAADVVAAARAALLDPEGPLSPLGRSLGQPLDRSDVVALLHAVRGVVGVPALTLPGAAGELGRLTAERWELVVLDPEPVLGGVAA